MKLRSLLIFVLFLPLLASASSRLSEMLIGEWHAADKDRSCTYTFRSDGTFAGTVTGKSKAVWQFSGRWSVSRDVIHYEYTRSSLKHTSAGATDEDKVLEIAPDHFVIMAADGVRRRYERLKPKSHQRHS